jgi:hypothetical protein
VAVFLNSLPDRWQELRRLADLRVRFLDAKPYLTTAYRDPSPLMHEIRMLSVGLNEAAGRTAYLAAFHVIRRKGLEAIL